MVRRGPPERELPALAREVGADAVHFARDVTPFARGRGERAGRALLDAGLTLEAHPGLNVVDDVSAIATGKGTPYTVFSPFRRTLGGRSAPRRAAPRRGVPPAVGCRSGPIPSLEELGLERARAPTRCAAARPRAGAGSPRSCAGR